MGKKQKQARALTSELLERIYTVAYEPRTGRGGWSETKDEARRRGSVDMAVLSLMRDGMLRVSEAEGLRWRDLEAVPDGTGRLHIRSSKTDQEGEGAIMFVSAPTMMFLKAIRDGVAPDDSIFGLRRKQMTNRIRKAAIAAGLGGRVQRTFAKGRHGPRPGEGGNFTDQPDECWPLEDGHDAGKLHEERECGKGCCGPVLRVPTRLYHRIRGE